MPETVRRPDNAARMIAALQEKVERLSRLASRKGHVHSLVSARWLRTVNQSVANNTEETLAGAAEDHSHDPDNIFSMSVGVVTVNRAGIYVVTTGGTWESNSTGGRRWAVRKNTTIVARSIVGAISSPLSQIVTTGPMSFADGDTFDARVTQFSGASLNVDVSITPAYLSVVRIGEAP